MKEEVQQIQAQNLSTCNTLCTQGLPQHNGVVAAEQLTVTVTVHIPSTLCCYGNLPIRSKHMTSRMFDETCKREEEEEGGGGGGGGGGGRGGEGGGGGGRGGAGGGGGGGGFPLLILNWG